MACETSIIQLGLCEGDIYVESVFYNTETEILSVTLNNGTVYTTSVPITEVVVSASANNQVQLLADGLYVPVPVLGVNNLAFENGENLQLTSDDNSVTISISKVGDEITADFSVDIAQDQHPALTVAPNAAYSFDFATQVLSIPLPTLVQDGVNSNLYVYTANDGSGTTYNIEVHPELTVTTDPAAFSFDQPTQALNIPQPSLTDNLDNTFTYNPGDGSAPVVINLNAAIVDVCDALASCTIGQLSNVDTTGANIGQVLQWNGTNWVPATIVQESGAVSSITNNGNGSYTHNDGLGTTVLIQTATNANQPFAKEGVAQQTRLTAIPITDKVYRTGALGVGLTSARTVQGIFEAAGDVFINNTGTITNVYLQAKYGTVDIKEIALKLTSKTNYYIHTIEDSAKSLSALDSKGNYAIGEISAKVTLPNDIYDANNTFTISNYNASSPPNVPLSVYSVTEFVLTI